MVTFTNQATLSYNGNVTNSNITTGEIADIPTVTKSAINSGYSQGESIAYSVSLINTSATALTCLTLSDNLGQYNFSSTSLTPLSYVAGTLRYFVNGAEQTAPSVTTTGNALQITGITVPANGNVLLIYEAKPNSYAPLAAGSSIENTVTVSGANISPVTASAIIDADQDIALTISKVLSPFVVTANDQVTYTFVVQNMGNIPTESTDSVIIRDTFTPALSNITVTLDGTPLSSGIDYVYSESTGIFSTVAGAINVPAAFFTQSSNGAYTTTPGVAVLTVTGTI